MLLRHFRKSLSGSPTYSQGREDVELSHGDIEVKAAITKKERASLSDFSYFFKATR